MMRWIAILLLFTCCGCGMMNTTPTPLAPKTAYAVTLTRPDGGLHSTWYFDYEEPPRIIIYENICYVYTPEGNRIVAPVGWCLEVMEKTRTTEVIFKNGAWVDPC